MTTPYDDDTRNCMCVPERGHKCMYHAHKHTNKLPLKHKDYTNSSKCKQANKQCSKYY